MKKSATGARALLAVAMMTGCAHAAGDNGLQKEEREARVLVSPVARARVE